MPIDFNFGLSGIFISDIFKFFSVKVNKCGSYNKEDYNYEFECTSEEDLYIYY